MFKRILLLSLLMCSNSGISGELVSGATIYEVASSSSNKDVFYIKLSGGTGPCANKSVEFPSSKSQSKESYNQAFSIALAALSSGKKIRVHNYEDASCLGANFIGIYAN
jgi:hypothetical protein